MSEISTTSQKEANMTDSTDKFRYNSFQGKEDVIEVSVVNKGVKRSVVLIETFSSAQFAMFEKWERKARELLNGDPEVTRVHSYDTASRHVLA